MKEGLRAKDRKVKDPRSKEVKDPRVTGSNKEVSYSTNNLKDVK